MKLISSILSATVCCSGALTLAQENCSLWPRRPAELDQAQRLYAQGNEDEEALALLQPFVNKRGLAGREARRLVGHIRVRQYLSASNPNLRHHTVRRGENLDRIAAAYESSPELLMFINMMTRPSDLKVGQRLNVAPANLRAELHVADRELTLWDGRTLVAAYDVYPSLGSVGDSGKNEEAALTDRRGEINGAHVPRASALFPSSDRVLTFSNGLVLINNKQRAPKKDYVQMQREDLNELSLLLRGGARLSVVRDEEKFAPFAVAEPDAESQKQKKSEGMDRNLSR